MQYYYFENGNKFGPFTFEELKNIHLTSNALVWRDGMDRWVKKNELPEFSDLYAFHTQVFDTLKTVRWDDKRIRLKKQIEGYKKAFIRSLYVGGLVFIGCILLFRPFKFDAPEYKDELRRLSGPFGSGTTYSPYWMSQGFTDYCDGLYWNPSDSRIYEVRKSHLLWKALRWGLYSIVASSMVLILFATNQESNEKQYKKPKS